MWDCLYVEGGGEGVCPVDVEVFPVMLLASMLMLTIKQVWYVVVGSCQDLGLAVLDVVGAYADQ